MGAMWDWINQHWDDQWAKFVEGILLLLLSIVIASLVRRWLRNQLKRPHIDPQVALLVSRIVYLAVLLLGIIAFFTRWLSSPTLVFGSFGFLGLAISLAFQGILQHIASGRFL